MSYGRDRTLVPVTIAGGASLSGEVNVGGGRIVGILMPAAWTAAGIAFQALLREPAALPKVPVYGSVQDAAGAAVNILTPAADSYVAIADTVALVGLGRILVRSGTNAVPVAQAAARDFFLVVIDA